jgi:hypothetical protein
MKQLEFLKAIEKYGAYTQKTVYRKANEDFVNHNMKSCTISGIDDPNVRISTKVKGMLWWKKYLPVLDCDGRAYFDLAVEQLNFHYPKVAWESFESTMDKFWIIIDKPMKIQDCLDFMCEMPGCHREYIAHCQSRKKIVLRGFPKGVWKPRQRIGANLAFRSSLFNNWVALFDRYWNLPIVEWVLSENQRQGRLNTVPVPYTLVPVRPVEPVVEIPAESKKKPKRRRIEV